MVIGRAVESVCREVKAVVMTVTSVYQKGYSVTCCNRLLNRTVEVLNSHFS